jgi:hypothetical protein
VLSIIYPCNTVESLSYILLTSEVNTGGQRNTTNHLKKPHTTNSKTRLQTQQPITKQQANSHREQPTKKNQHAWLSLREQGRHAGRKTTAYTNLGIANPMDKEVTEIYLILRRLRISKSEKNIYVVKSETKAALCLPMYMLFKLLQILARPCCIWTGWWLVYLTETHTSNRCVLA